MNWLKRVQDDAVLLDALLQIAEIAYDAGYTAGQESTAEGEIHDLYEINRRTILHNIFGDLARRSPDER